LIRIAGPDDFEVVYELVVDFVQTSPYKDDEIDHEKFREFVYNLLIADKTQSMVFLLEDGSGVLVATSVEKFWSTEKTTLELMFWIRPESRNYQKAKVLVHAYEYWAKEIVRAKTIQLAVIDDRVSKLYRRWGYTLAENSYMKEI
jgi:hypothetical protein